MATPTGDIDRRVAEWLVAGKYGSGAGKPVDGSEAVFLHPTRPLPTREFRITQLSFQRPPDDATKLADLQQLESLHHVGIDGPAFDDEFIAKLQKIPNLQLMQIVNTSITEKAIDHFAGFANLTGFALDRNTKLTGAGYARLPTLSNLEGMTIIEDNVDDAAVGHFAKIAKLDSLTVESANVTNDGLRALGLAKGLTSLGLACPRIDDAGMPHLAALRLKFLSIRKTKITGPGLTHIVKDDVTRLWARETPMTDTGVGHIAQMKQLNEVQLGQCPNITDESLRYLAELTSLTHLDVSNCNNVSDTGMAHLAKLKSLRQLHVGGTKVTRQGGLQLKKALPDCRIYGAGPDL
jgi:hypothetical protein